MTQPLDPAIADLCDSAAQWIHTASAAARHMGVTLPAGLAAMLPRTFTGYAPKVDRTETRARAYAAWLLSPPARETAADRAVSNAAAAGFVDGRFVALP